MELREDPARTDRRGRCAQQVNPIFPTPMCWPMSLVFCESVAKYLICTWLNGPAHVSVTSPAAELMFRSPCSGTGRPPSRYR